MRLALALSCVTIVCAVEVQDVTAGDQGAASLRRSDVANAGDRTARLLFGGDDYYYDNGFTSLYHGRYNRDRYRYNYGYNDCYDQPYGNTYGSLNYYRNRYRGYNRCNDYYNGYYNRPNDYNSYYNNDYNGYYSNSYYNRPYYY